jgi:hypothetical protein
VPLRCLYKRRSSVHQQDILTPCFASLSLFYFIVLFRAITFLLFSFEIQIIHSLFANIFISKLMFPKSLGTALLGAALATNVIAQDASLATRHSSGTQLCSHDIGCSRQSSVMIDT